MTLKQRANTNDRHGSTTSQSSDQLWVHPFPLHLDQVEGPTDLRFAFCLIPQLTLPRLLRRDISRGWVAGLCPIVSKRLGWTLTPTSNHGPLANPDKPAKDTGPTGRTNTLSKIINGPHCTWMPLPNQNFPKA